MIDNMEVYLAYARYFMFIHAYDQAEVYYEIVLKNVNNMLGHKRQIHEEIALLKARKKQYEEAYTSLKEPVREMGGKRGPRRLRQFDLLR